MFHFLQKIRVFQSWTGYKWSNSKANKERPWIQVRKCSRILGGNMTNRVALGRDKATGTGYSIIGSKSEFKIIDSAGRLVAEVISHMFLLIHPFLFVFPPSCSLAYIIGN